MLVDSRLAMRLFFHSDLYAIDRLKAVCRNLGLEYKERLGNAILRSFRENEERTHMENGRRSSASWSEVYFDTDDPRLADIPHHKGRPIFPHFLPGSFSRILLRQIERELILCELDSKRPPPQS